MFWAQILHSWKIQVWVFPKIGVPQNGWFIMENPTKMDDSGVPLFSETSIYELEYLGTKPDGFWGQFSVSGPPFDPPLHPPWLCGFHGNPNRKTLGGGFSVKTVAGLGGFLFGGEHHLSCFEQTFRVSNTFFLGGGGDWQVFWLPLFLDSVDFGTLCTQLHVFFDFVVKKIWLWLSTGWCLPIFYTIYQLIEQFRPLDPQTRGSIEKCHIIHIFIKTI